MLKYAITDPAFYGDFRAAWREFARLREADFVLFRDKTCADYAAWAREFKFEFDRVAEEFKFEKKPLFFVKNDINLAQNIGADGVHFDFSHISNLIFAPRDLIKIASCHNEREIFIANKFGVDFITFSPVFASPHKGLAAGLGALKRACKISSVPVIALGGVSSREQIEQIANSGAVGFAGIRYFVR